MSGAAEDAGAVHRRENRWAGRARSTRLRAVLPLAEIHRLARTVDGDRRSPVADAAAAPWDHPAGTARWWRSSAGHVFVLPEQGRRPRAYLRLQPAERVGAGRVHAVAALTRGLHARGVPVAPPVPSREGNLVETVATELGLVHAARDLVSHGLPTAEHRERHDRLLAGYLSVRPQAGPHLTTLPLFARMHAAVGLAQLRALLAAAAPPGPDVLPELRSGLTALARHHREQLLGP